MCDDCIETCNAIGELTAEEGSALTILAANPELRGPGRAIEVTSDWTGWHQSRFEGGTLLQALSAAVSDKRLTKKLAAT